MTKICKNCGLIEKEHYQDIAGMPLMCEPFGSKKFEEDKTDLIKAEMNHLEKKYAVDEVMGKTKKQPENHSSVATDMPEECVSNSESLVGANPSSSGAFNLSKERTFAEGFEGRKWFYYEEDVKEFIRLRNRLDNDLRNNRITWNKYLDERRELSGEHLR